MVTNPSDRNRPKAGGSGASPADDTQTNRRQDIVLAAAKKFGALGYDATTMRDIAAEAGILAGSIYYHFASKEELLIAVHHEAVERIKQRVVSGIDPSADAWTRLRQASAKYIESLAEERQFADVILAEFPRRRSREIAGKMIRDRDSFELVFREIIDELPLEPWVDRSIWRMALLSILAWSLVWFRKGGMSTEEVAQHLVDLMQHRTAMEGPAAGDKPGD